jgi:hypothetical protein
MCRRHEVQERRPLCSDRRHRLAVTTSPARFAGRTCQT